MDTQDVLKQNITAVPSPPLQPSFYISHESCFDQISRTLQALHAAPALKNISSPEEKILILLLDMDRIEGNNLLKFAYHLFLKHPCPVNIRMCAAASSPPAEPIYVPVSGAPSLSCLQLTALSSKRSLKNISSSLHGAFYPHTS